MVFHWKHAKDTRCYNMRRYPEKQADKVAIVVNLKSIKKRSPKIHKNTLFNPNILQSFVLANRNAIRAGIVQLQAREKRLQISS